ncbi:IS5 family transposase [Pokkaliibacter sp. MBI-7]|uniref:IS5 family transposase n=1 Tax=Pokkaliibacter sp. MBI-7 TaxID=3040600 RepID=UPI002448CFB3|nr:IS5 family transposase [Pokkaliibacter sp. MBI-7]MDH2430957.1 IS5 family transposase [Pokkaliibacter sp. MBI-7]MDH2431085.1 IS5 family transposase [Pokkaliibacter sp. MBI-7]MDH2434010.1 IS5 family transposase [Pokkaliibacter sp. MBI-7]MDH2434711.1 IS5 family transposase [Pokkaliibacter sp. MBI-7]MDH2434751.1 IS5 family transposase [Pokkaliibacter sp. MBI-7]
MNKPASPQYKTINWKSYNAALKARGSLMIWLDRDMNWYGSACGKRGRTPTFSDAAIQFCLTIKCLYNLALRQAVGMVQSLLKLAGLDWPTPDYSTVCRRQKSLQVVIPCCPATTGLHLLIDSTGIKMLGEGEWKTKKHGADYRRQWRKVHLGIDAHTLEIRAIEVTDNAVGDAPMLPGLLSQIPVEEKIASVSGDGAYDTRGCHEAIARREAEAVIPTRQNAKPWKENRPGASARNEILRATRRLGRTLWKKWSGYHRRSLVETKMHCFKRLGERVMARDFDRQVAELQVRAAILNRFTRLGTPMTVRIP